MKSKDVAVIIGIAGFSAIIAFLISSNLVASSSNLSTTVEVVELINTDFKDADIRYFNEEAINPTQIINVDENQNSNPFDNPNEEPAQ